MPPKSRPLAPVVAGGLPALHGAGVAGPFTLPCLAGAGGGAGAAGATGRGAASTSASGGGSGAAGALAGRPLRGPLRTDDPLVAPGPPFVESQKG